MDLSPLGAYLANDADLNDFLTTPASHTMSVGSLISSREHDRVSRIRREAAAFGFARNHCGEMDWDRLADGGLALTIVQLTTSDDANNPNIPIPKITMRTSADSFFQPMDANRSIRNVHDGCASRTGHFIPIQNQFSQPSHQIHDGFRRLSHQGIDGCCPPYLDFHPINNNLGARSIRSSVPPIPTTTIQPRPSVKRAHSSTMMDFHAGVRAADDTYLLEGRTSEFVRPV